MVPTEEGLRCRGFPFFLFPPQFWEYSSPARRVWNVDRITKIIGWGIKKAEEEIVERGIMEAGYLIHYSTVRGDE